MKKQSNNHANGLSTDSRDSQITPAGIQAQLERVLSSPDFKASRKVRTIFRYLTEEKMTGNERHISAQSIASKAHGRPLGPDPNIDPLVRIQVNHLRRALKGYDAGAGAADDGPRIDIPEDRYTPVFHSKKKKRWVDLFAYVAGVFLMSSFLPQLVKNPGTEGQALIEPLEGA